MNERYTPDDTRDLLREIGGLLLGLAVAMIYIRKGPFISVNPDQWAAFPMFVILALAAVYLYGGAIVSRAETGGLRPWQVVHSVFGLVFIALALRELVDMLGGTPSADLNTFWIAAVTAGCAFYAGFVAGVRVQILLGAIAVIVSWTTLWDKILSDGVGSHWGAYRGLLGLLSIGLLAAALYVWRNNPGGDQIADTATEPAGDLGLWKASELLTGAGIAAVIACSLGITALGNLNPLGTGTPPIETSNLWDVLLLLVSLGIIAISAQIGTRGPAYVGAIGLVGFLIIIGLDLNSTPPHPFEFGGWPWVLLILGLIAVGLSFTREAGLGDQPRRLVQNLRGR
jgi:hypothetical protein